MTTVTETNSMPKTKKPSDSAFKQQRLPAWQPILTAGTVLPTFFVIGIAFIPVGISLLYMTNNVKEFPYDYTHCKSVDHPNIECADIITNNSKTNIICRCSENFTLQEEFLGSVYMYYGLTNFYQNHRRYVKSRDDNQLLGRLDYPLSSDCDPFSVSDGPGGKPFAPCGAIANSLFSDQFRLFFYEPNQPQPREVPLIRTGIAWPSDKKSKFKNPPGNLTKAFERFEKPRNWSKYIWELDLEDESNNGFQNEDLIVWMRTAALPDFRKLYRRINHTADEIFAQGLNTGNYRLDINYTYQVSAFEGTKRMILSTTSLLGGKNQFLGYAYIVVGCICLVLGIGLLIIHIKFSKSTNAIINVNQNTPYR